MLPGPLHPPEFFYAGSREELAQKTLLVSVWAYNLGTADDFIGGVQLSGRASGERQRHWRECLGHSDRRLELWHTLDGVPFQLRSSRGACPDHAHRFSPKLTHGHLHRAARTWGCLTYCAQPRVTLFPPLIFQICPTRKQE